MSNAGRKVLRGMIRRECERQHYKKAGRQVGPNYHTIRDKQVGKGVKE